jgi:hypothetical protein
MPMPMGCSRLIGLSSGARHDNATISTNLWDRHLFLFREMAFDGLGEVCRQIVIGKALQR